MANPIPAEPQNLSTAALDTGSSDDATGALGNLNTPEFTAALTLRPALPDGMVLLSQWLADVPDNELCCVLSDYQQAVRTTIDALPVHGQSFTRAVTDPQNNGGRPTNRKLEEELIRDTPEAREWLREKRSESRHVVMRHTGKVALPIEELARDPADFDRLLAERRAFLEQQHAAPAPKASPRSPARSKPKTQAKPSVK